jgi:hypothetical protein
MKKLILILIPLMVISGLAATLLVLNDHKTPQWQVELSQYLAYQNGTGEQPLVLVTTARASQPWNFTSAMSQASFSDSVIFETDISPSWSTPVGVQPLPYPPEQVWCALLHQDAMRQVVFVALHSDMYNADWVVHLSTAAWGSPELQSTLDSLGCKLPK